MGSVTGLLPITGVPLPLVSFGGTALVATLAGIGVLASIARGSGPAGSPIAAPHAPCLVPGGRVKVVIAGGGTGGHVFPGLALADRLRADHGASVEFIGSPAGPESTLVPEAGYPFHPVEAAPLYRELSLRAARAPFVALRSVRASRPLLAEADALVGRRRLRERAAGPRRAPRPRPAGAARAERGPEPGEPAAGAARRRPSASRSRVAGTGLRGQRRR